MRILIAYFTLTGNTETVARAIHEEAQSLGHEADLRKIRKLKPESLGEYDVVFLGAPCHHSDLPKGVKRFVEGLPASSSFQLAGFVTHATYLPEGTDRKRQLHQEWAGKCLPTLEKTCEAKGIPFAGYFSCQGRPSKMIGMLIHRTIIKDPTEWAEYLPEVKKHPTAEDLQRARAFARGGVDPGRLNTSGAPAVMGGVAAVLDPPCIPDRLPTSAQRFHLSVGLQASEST